MDEVEFGHRRIPTTEYATWTQFSGGTTHSVHDSVRKALGDRHTEYDVAAIATQYQDAINELLPDGVSLHNEFVYGPYPRPGWWANPTAQEWADLRSALETLDRTDFWEIAKNNALS